MAYIPSYQTLARHPKMQEAARLLGIEEATMIGHLHLLWYWAMDYAPDGDLAACSPASLAAGAQWRGDAAVFVDALCNCGYGGAAGFLDRDASGALCLHDWHDYGGKLAREKQANAARLRAHRTPPTAPAANPRRTSDDADDPDNLDDVDDADTRVASVTHDVHAVHDVRNGGSGDGGGGGEDSPMQRVRNAYEMRTYAACAPLAERREEQRRAEQRRDPPLRSV